MAEYTVLNMKKLLDRERGPQFPRNIWLALKMKNENVVHILTSLIFLTKVKKPNFFVTKCLKFFGNFVDKAFQENVT